MREFFTGSAAELPGTDWKCLERWRKGIFSVWTATGICMGTGYLSGHYFSEGALREQLEKAYPGLVFTEEPVENQINMYKRDKVGHILSLTVGNKTISGEEFRQLLELPSSNFTMQAADRKIRFLCKGQGHGLGLSQYGGNVLAKEGKSYQEILRYYFPECEVKTKKS